MTQRLVHLVDLIVRRLQLFLLRDQLVDLSGQFLLTFVELINAGSGAPIQLGRQLVDVILQEVVLLKLLRIKLLKVRVLRSQAHDFLLVTKSETVHEFLFLTSEFINE